MPPPVPSRFLATEAGQLPATGLPTFDKKISDIERWLAENVLNNNETKLWIENQNERCKDIYLGTGINGCHGDFRLVKCTWYNIGTESYEAVKKEIEGGSICGWKTLEICRCACENNDAIIVLTIELGK